MTRPSGTTPMGNTGNDELYADGLVNRALDLRTQPLEIQEFLNTEEALVHELVPDGAAVVDLGCGAGRHLMGLAGLKLGVGVDYEPSYIAQARRLRPPPNLHFIVGDATAVPLGRTFDVAVCLASTWGTMSDKLAVLDEMKRLAPRFGGRLITVYGQTSVEPRLEWYRNMGQDVVDVTDEHLQTKDGFVSEHFTEDRIRKLVGDCTLHPIGTVGYMVQT
ncbi:MAG: class I SAM-dependent methyltransferase [Longimicrobiales bacterium]